MKNKIKYTIAVIVLMLISVINTFAQPPAPSPSSGALPTVDNTLTCNVSVPISDGYWVLIALAVAYGIYLYRTQLKSRLA